MTTNGWIEVGQYCLEKLELQSACEAFLKAVELSNGTNQQALHMLAMTYMENGQLIEAKNVFETLISLNPNSDDMIEIYLYMAQMSEGEEALNRYQSSLDLLIQKHQNLNNNNNNNNNMMIENNNNDQIKNLKSIIISTLCSIADLFLTDLCYNDNAESNCEEAINQALSYNNESIEALQTMASLKISQEKPQDAVEIMKNISQKLIEQDNIMHLLSDPDGLNNENNNLNLNFNIENEEEYLSSIEPVTQEISFRLSTVRLLLELTQYDVSLAESASELIDNLLEINDENIELWFLRGCSALNEDPKDLEMARESLDKAKNMMEKNLEFWIQNNNNEEFPYQSQLESINAQITLLEEYEQK